MTRDRVRLPGGALATLASTALGAGCGGSGDRDVPAAAAVVIVTIPMVITVVLFQRRIVAALTAAPS